MKYIVYHADCPDGLCAAALASLEHPTALTWALTYSDPCPNFLPGDDVMIVDFRLPLADIRRLHDIGVTFSIFDHHKSNIDEHLALGHLELDRLYHRCVLDNSRSGAGLVHESVLQHDTVVSDVWKYVEDRDLWKFQLPDSKVINAGIAALLPMTGPRTPLLSLADPIASWVVALRSPAMMSEFKTAGTVALRAQRARIEKALSRAIVASPVLPSRVYKAVFANVSCDGSEFGDAALAKYPEADFCATYFDDYASNARVWSLRARTNSSVDVAAIATLFGGGGHRAAAGFTAPINTNPFEGHS